LARIKGKSKKESISLGQPGVQNTIIPLLGKLMRPLKVSGQRTLDQSVPYFEAL
jgi:hypothetical protein